MTTEYVVTVPDIGTSAAVEVIEILVKPGDEVTEGMSLITLESDKASMEIPAPQAGIVKALQVTLGKKIMQGDVILTLESAAAEASVKTPESVVVPIAAPTTPATPEPTNVVALKEVPTSESDTSTDLIFAGPAVRRLARELGVELSVIPGTGQKQRITSEDVHRYVKQALQNRGSSMVSAAPVIDFSQFGSVEFTPLHKIKRLTAAQVHRSWVSIPHVTQFDEADVTDLDAFRKSENAHAEKAGYKLTMLAFVTKAVVRALMEYPSFNASLDASGEQLILKHYY
ncbi:MAG: 2-oxo acid dehydrogenase subunit E2, partial [Legionellaceae bacterium]|nr:2-oxo acid dehydrogenase subunit E2 [Legionellaceae bacterium]